MIILMKYDTPHHKNGWTQEMCVSQNVRIEQTQITDFSRRTAPNIGISHVLLDIVRHVRICTSMYTSYNRYIRNGIITFVTTHLGKMIYDRGIQVPIQYLYIFKVGKYLVGLGQILNYVMYPCFVCMQLLFFSLKPIQFYILLVFHFAKKLVKCTCTNYTLKVHKVLCKSRVCMQLLAVVYNLQKIPRLY